MQATANKALRVTVEAMGIALTASQSDELVAHYHELDVWPDVKPALGRLREKGHSAYPALESQPGGIAR